MHETLIDQFCIIDRLSTTTICSTLESSGSHREPQLIGYWTIYQSARSTSRNWSISYGLLSDLVCLSRYQSKECMDGTLINRPQPQLISPAVSHLDQVECMEPPIDRIFNSSLISRNRESKPWRNRSLLFSSYGWQYCGWSKNQILESLKDSIKSMIHTYWTIKSGRCNAFNNYNRKQLRRLYYLTCKTRFLS
jgi:hypothetical protein